MKHLLLFQRQERLHECVALLRCMCYITSFVNTKHMPLNESLVLRNRNVLLSAVSLHTHSSAGVGPQ